MIRAKEEIASLQRELSQGNQGYEDEKRNATDLEKEIEMLKYENIRLKDENIKREADAKQANIDFEQGKEAFI